MKQYLKYWCSPGYPGDPSNDPPPLAKGRGDYPLPNLTYGSRASLCLDIIFHLFTNDTAQTYADTPVTVTDLCVMK